MGKWSSASWLFLVRNIQRTKDSLFSYLIFADEKKTIKPASAGGQGNPIEILFHARLLKIFNTIIAGGQKYIVQGIFFKFALGMFFTLPRQNHLSYILFSPPRLSSCLTFSLQQRRFAWDLWRRWICHVISTPSPPSPDGYLTLFLHFVSLQESSITWSERSSWLFQFWSFSPSSSSHGNAQNCNKCVSDLSISPSLIQALIDYMGFRLIAISILPVNHGNALSVSSLICWWLLQDTLKYGSGDAGVTIHNDDATLSSLMKEAAAKMNIKVLLPP